MEKLKCITVEKQPSMEGGRFIYPQETLDGYSTYVEGDHMIPLVYMRKNDVHKLDTQKFTAGWYTRIYGQWQGTLIHHELDDWGKPTGKLRVVEALNIGVAMKLAKKMAKLHFKNL